MTQPIPFIGGEYTGRNKALNAQVCQNLYIEVDKTGAKNPISLTNTPGTTYWLHTDNIAEVRTFYIFGGNLFVVCGNTLYKITTAKVKTTIGTIGTAAGWCYITDDGTNMMIIDNSGGWTCDGTTLTAIADADFPSSPSSATFQDGYHIVTLADTDTFQISASDDATDWDATDFANVEGDSDNLLRAISVRRLIWFIGERTTEIWYNSGATFPFERSAGGFLRVGCNSARSIAQFEDTLLWLDDKNRVVQTVGNNYKPVSTPSIEYQISQMGTKSNSIGFCYQQEGHTFYVLTFPTDSKTICYDLTTGLWHTRASGTEDKRERANCYILFDDNHLVGDFEHGMICTYDLDAYGDAGYDDPLTPTACCTDKDNDADVTTGWTATDATLTSESDAYGVTGNYLKVAATAANGKATKDMTLTSGKIYHFRARAKADAGGDEYKVRVASATAAANLYTSGEVAGDGSTWDTIVDTSECTSTQTDWQVRLIAVNNTDNAYFDNVYLAEIIPNAVVKRAIRIGQHIHANRKHMFLHCLEVEFESGVGITATTVGHDPQAMFQYSKDDGQTWSNEKWRSMGKKGEYTKRSRWNRLGSAITFTPRLIITDPVKRKIVNAHLDFTVGDS